jgi:hypothetical protein
MNNFKQYTHYRAPVTSKGVNQGRIGFFPKGRYFGFDTFSANPNSIPGNPTLLLSHTEKLRFTDSDGTIKQVGVAVSPHGNVIHSYAPIVLSIPDNPASYPVYGALVMRYTWGETIPHNDPTFFIQSTGTTVPHYGFLEEETDVILGIVTIGPSPSSHADLSLEVLPSPFFGDRDLDSHFARLNFGNIFKGFNGSQKTSLTDADISYSSNGLFFLNLLGTTYNEISLSAKSQDINFIIPPPILQGPGSFALVGIKIKETSGGTITFKGGNLGNLLIGTDITFEPGDSFLLYGYGGGWSIISSFSKLHRLIQSNEAEILYNRSEIQGLKTALVYQTPLVDISNNLYLSVGTGVDIFYSLKITMIGTTFYRIKGSFTFPSFSFDPNFPFHDYYQPLSGAGYFLNHPVTMMGEIAGSTNIQDHNVPMCNIFKIYIGKIDPGISRVPSIQILSDERLWTVYNPSFDIAGRTVNFEKLILV